MKQALATGQTSTSSLCWTQFSFCIDVDLAHH